MKLIFNLTIRTPLENIYEREEVSDETCANCKYADHWFNERPCAGCFPLKGFSKWEARNDDAQV